MTTKTDTEQLRADFEAWASQYTNYPQKYDQIPAWQAYQAGRAVLQSQDRKDTFCVWHNDPETDNSWDTSCRQLFELYDGTPTENGMKFCCYCGGRITPAIDHARRAEGDGE